MELRVLIVAQSNRGDNALFEGCTKTLGQNGQVHLLDNSVRMISELSETALAYELEVGMSDGAPPLRPQNIGWLVASSDSGIANEHPKDDTAKQYNHIASSNSTGTNRHLTYPGPPTDIVVFHKAGQTADPDLLIALLDQRSKLKLSIFAGDIRQLTPVVDSFTSNRNSPSNVYATSVLRRIIKAYPHFSHTKLFTNYRGHPSTFAMPSSIVYDGEIVAGGRIVRWNTPLATNMYKLLDRPDFLRAFH
ncbi:hypothetical protein LTS10_003665 [Elasticomyces elasticus]|nr:hypothetical protein LTS10_003665 [Elasticomyces elasticus]